MARLARALAVQLGTPPQRRRGRGARRPRSNETLLGGGGDEEAFHKISITIATSGRLRPPPRRAVPARPTPSARPAPGPGRPRSPGLRPWGCAAQLIAWRSLPVPFQRQHSRSIGMDPDRRCHQRGAGQDKPRGLHAQERLRQGRLLCTPICDS